MAHHIFRCEMLGQGVLRGVTNQPTWLANLVHDRITGINTGAAANTFILLPLANINARWTNHDAQVAIDAIAQRCSIGAFFACTTWFTTLRIIGNHQRIRVKHHALKTRVGAHIFANLFA